MNEGNGREACKDREGGFQTKERKQTLAIRRTQKSD